MLESLVTDVLDFALQNERLERSEECVSVLLQDLVDCDEQALVVLDIQQEPDAELYRLLHLLRVLVELERDEGQNHRLEVVLHFPLPLLLVLGDPCQQLEPPSVDLHGVPNHLLPPVLVLVHLQVRLPVPNVADDDPLPFQAAQEVELPGTPEDVLVDIGPVDSAGVLGVEEVEVVEVLVGNGGDWGGLLADGEKLDPCLRQEGEEVVAEEGAVEDGGCGGGSVDVVPLVEVVHSNEAEVVDGGLVRDHQEEVGLVGGLEPSHPEFDDADLVEDDGFQESLPVGDVELQQGDGGDCEFVVVEGS